MLKNSKIFFFDARFWKKAVYIVENHKKVKIMNRKRDFKLICFSLLMAGLGMLLTDCSKDDEPTNSPADEEIQNNGPLGFWNLNGFIELTPQSTPPYLLIVSWNDEKEKESLDQFVAENGDIVLELFDPGDLNWKYMTTTKIINSSDFYVSMSYKGPNLQDNEYIQVFPRIVLMLNEGNSIEAIQNKYANVMTLDHDSPTAYGRYVFNCNVNTSNEVLRLATEIHERNDVKWAEPELMLPIHLD